MWLAYVTVKWLIWREFDMTCSSRLICARQVWQLLCSASVYHMCCCKAHRPICGPKDVFDLGCVEIIGWEYGAETKLIPLGMLLFILGPWRWGCCKVCWINIIEPCAAWTEQGKIRSQDTGLWEGRRLGVLAICALVLGRGTRKRGSCICETGLAFSLIPNLTLVILQQWTSWCFLN